MATMLIKKKQLSGTLRTNPGTRNMVSLNDDTPEQAPAGSRIYNPGISGTGFCKIPGSRDFSGWDFPIFLIPGFRKKIVIFRDFHFCFICLSNRIIFINIYHHHLHSSPTILLYHHHSLRSLLATLLSHYPQIDVRNID